ncbi:hypothetical protein FA15DRAFT_721392 [Coprinopsis marcescibilis]|uniref:Uncharacterized protein n=1 Tax=Coprinopsis marcescibilis TaxID=230819 RepID=A0A5C3KJ49_COPMA|nr:hypothetical protein FA15DRAFT_721392 [Coprinopsis marcescibilis]
MLSEADKSSIAQAEYIFRSEPQTGTLISIMASGEWWAFTFRINPTLQKTLLHDTLPFPFNATFLDQDANCIPVPVPSNNKPAKKSRLNSMQKKPSRCKDAVPKPLSKFLFMLPTSCQTRASTRRSAASNTMPTSEVNFADEEDNNQEWDLVENTEQGSSTTMQEPSHAAVERDRGDKLVDQPKRHRRDVRTVSWNVQLAETELAGHNKEQSSNKPGQSGPPLQSNVLQPNSQPPQYNILQPNSLLQSNVSQIDIPFQSNIASLLNNSCCLKVQIVPTIDTLPLHWSTNDLRAMADHDHTQNAPAQVVLDLKGDAPSGAESDPEPGDRHFHNTAVSLVPPPAPEPVRQGPGRPRTKTSKVVTVHWLRDTIKEKEAQYVRKLRDAIPEFGEMSQPILFGTPASNQRFYMICELIRMQVEALLQKYIGVIQPTKEVAQIEEARQMT